MPPAANGDSDGESKSSDEGEGEDGDEEAEEFDFALFSTAGATAKVTLKDDVFQGDGAFSRHRPLSEFLVKDISEDLKAEYAFAALSPEEIVARSRQHYWALKFPWRVTHVTVHKKGDPPTVVSDPEEKLKRRRPGKKRRVALRTRERARKTREEEKRKKAEEKKEQEAEKEEHMKDKKKRLNRLKKLRRKAKDKEKKAGAKAEGDDGGLASGDESAGSGE